MWQLLRSLRYRQPRPAIRVPRQKWPAFDFYLLSTSILGSQKRKIPNVEAGSMDGFRLYCSELDEMEAKLASWSFAFVFETFSNVSQCQLSLLHFSLLGKPMPEGEASLILFFHI
ncbi:uncharacterized protein [Populus alba]|uniref:uncharacterized protein n=1 Tax=Populus alba TaxID=43335 RepID=UPI003CC6FF9E